MTTSGLFPDGDERHDKALDEAIAEHPGDCCTTRRRRDETTTLVAAYHRSLAEQGARFVEVSEVAEWLRSYGLDGPPDYVHAFLARFGGGDEG